jgi:hypothetical protein
VREGRELLRNPAASPTHEFCTVLESLFVLHRYADATLGTPSFDGLSPLSWHPRKSRRLHFRGLVYLLPEGYDVFEAELLLPERGYRLEDYVLRLGPLDPSGHPSAIPAEENLLKTLDRLGTGGWAHVFKKDRR